LDCFETRKLLHLHVDTELDALKSAEVESHLQECASCGAAARELKGQLVVLAAGIETYRAPAALRMRIEAMAAGGAASADGVRTALPRTARWWAGWWGAWPAIGGFAVGALCALLAVFTWQQGWQGSAPYDAAVSAHVRSLMPTGHLIDVASSDRHTVKPWFAGKLDFSPPVPDLTLSGYPLLGGRVDYLADRPSAALVYRARQHTINVFVARGKMAGDVRPAARAQGGFNVVRWSDGGLDYWAVSDLSSNELADFAGLLKQGS
jgi:anti-sigma factor RsiW